MLYILLNPGKTRTSQACMRVGRFGGKIYNTARADA